MKSAIKLLILLSNVISFSLSHADDQVTPLETKVFNDQSTYFISTNGVRVRSATDGTGKLLGELSLNDKVKIINPTVIKNNFIEVNIVLTHDPIIKSERYFVSIAYIIPALIDYKKFVGNYFVVVNVATETLRLYERLCADNSCPHKMILETEVVVGEDVDHPKEEKGKGRSILGSYRVTGWAKFYQDAEGHYPSWYKEGYPETPGSDADWNDWLSKKVMPKDEKGKAHGSMRGAFGWFTAFVAPEPFGQWTHGTLGWGSDQDKFIKRVKKRLINVVSDPRSSGCTRNNNEAIAFLRKMIDVGAPIIKIYAKEEILDSSMNNYPNHFEDWDYVMTKTKSHAVDSADVIKSLGVTTYDLDNFLRAKLEGGTLILDPSDPLNEVLEVNTYMKDIHPDIIAFTPGEKLGKFKRKIGQKGNVYGIANSEMHGVFYIDTGLLENYAHPDTVLEVSGFPGEVTPSWMNYSNLQ